MGGLNLLVGLLPVVLFLAALMLMDSYKLVSRKSVTAALAAGAAAASACFLVNQLLLGAGLDERLLHRYVAPVIEEISKAIYIVFLIRSARV